MTVTALKAVLLQHSSTVNWPGLMTYKDLSNKFCYIFLLLAADLISELKV